MRKSVLATVENLRSSSNGDSVRASSVPQHLLDRGINLASVKL